MYMSLDQISIIFVILTAYLFPIIILIAWDFVNSYAKFFYFNIIVLEFILFNIFISADLLFFYIWFESSVVPMFFIITIWGTQSRKIKAAFYLLIYTLIFSAGFLFCILYIKYFYGCVNIYYLKTLILSRKAQLMFGFFFFLAFAVKMPIFPFHLWLPEAHVEAPAVGSVVLAGLLLKIGYFGFIKFFFILPQAIEFYRPIFSVLCICGCIFGALFALSQSDIKKVVAYASVSHMSLVMLGFLTTNIFGLIGSYLMAISHTIISSGLFCLVGNLYDRYHTRVIDYYSGLSSLMPTFSFFFFYFIISNFGFPLSITFVSEILILVGIAKYNFSVLLFLIIYSVLSTAYNLWLYVRVFHGTTSISISKNLLFLELSKKEFFTIFILFLTSVFLCFFPSALIDAVIPYFFLYAK
jgi:proton-translocating NADH-quinone oxidoreductase chain M